MGSSLPLRRRCPRDSARPLPDLSLKEAREAARQNRARIQQGVDVAAEKRAGRLKAQEQTTVSAQWSEFDLKRGVWSLHPSRTKKNQSVDIPLAAPVLRWLEEVQVFSCNSEYLFPARRLIHMKGGVPGRNRFGHISPDMLNVALRRLPLDDIEHFTVHDMRRTARTHMAALGVDRFVAERALNHKVRDVEGVYNQYDYFEERKVALERWAKWLAAIEEARNGGAASTQASEDAMAALTKQAQELGMGYERSGRRSCADDTNAP